MFIIKYNFTFKVIDIVIMEKVFKIFEEFSVVDKKHNLNLMSHLLFVLINEQVFFLIARYQQKSQMFKLFKKYI